MNSATDRVKQIIICKSNLNTHTINKVPVDKKQDIKNNKTVGVNLKLVSVRNFQTMSRKKWCSR